MQNRAGISDSSHDSDLVRNRFRSLSESGLQRGLQQLRAVLALPVKCVEAELALTPVELV